MSARKKPANKPPLAVREPLADATTARGEAPTPGMFSAASFAGVVAEYDPRKKPEAASLPACPVVAFYGFRGGAGRTTALAHVVASLSARQKHVVAIDLDLEAPGLHHVLGCPEPEEERGALALLRTAALVDDPAQDDRMRLAPHLLRSPVEVGAPIRVLPAGQLSEAYLERLEDLGVPLWHLVDGASPLQALVDRTRSELAPDVICLDCRTGLSGLAASAAFHVADVVVCFVPVSRQSLSGLATFLKALKAAQLHRHGRPDVLLVPSMVPEGREGQQRLAETFIPRIESLYAEIVLGERLTDDNALELTERVPLVREGIEYRRAIALTDALGSDYSQRSSGAYQSMLRALDGLLSSSTPLEPATSVDAEKVLDELEASGNLKNLAFAESTDPATIVEKFIQPQDFKAIIDRSTWYVVGAKGAGKTWLWQYLLSDVASSTLADQHFVAGRAPKDVLLTQNAMRELERDRGIKLEKNGLLGAMWLFDAVGRVLSDHREVLPTILGAFHRADRPLLQRLAEASKPDAHQAALAALLALPKAGSLAEHLMRTLDAALLESGSKPVTLVYDGLDTGFGSDPADIERRTRFVDALVDAIEPLRGVTKRLGFKLFLREDVYSAIGIQNQSHLGAATIELKWSPSDLWLLALNLVAASPSFMAAARSIEPSVTPSSWPREEERRRALLVPLWGDEMEHGNKIHTATFVQRRTSDGRDRLFPRTLVQLLHAAIERQRELGPANDRVLRAAAILAGYNAASTARVKDLRTEYTSLEAYLDALKERNPTGTETELVEHIKKQLSKAKRAKNRMGAPAGALHAGPGGWHKVIERLLEVGVLREYKRARGDGGEKKYEIALLYRPGLGIKAYGV